MIFSFSDKLPIGQWMEHIVDWLIVHGDFYFETFSIVIESFVMKLTQFLLVIPPYIFIIILLVFLVFKRRQFGLSLFCTVSLLLIHNLAYWEAMIETLVLVLSSTFICVIVGIPIGVAIAHRPFLYRAVRPVLDLMQTIPTFVYLIPTLTLFGLGVVPGLISTVIFSVAAPIRLTHLGISEVPKDLIEAGKSFGCTDFQLLVKIEIPSALPSIMTGVTQCIMLSLSMVVIAALVGANGLGKPVIQALNTVDIAKGFEAGLVIVLLAILMDRICKVEGLRKGVLG